jgi:hypothetical protein
MDVGLLYQGTLTEGERLSTVDLLIETTCFVKRKVFFQY